MALINCPECGKEVSDKAPACIHCGYPLEKKSEEPKFHKVILTSCGAEKVKVIRTIREVTGLGLAQAKDYADNPPKLIANGLTLDDAQYVARQFTSIGAMVSIEGDTESTSRNDIRAKIAEVERQRQLNTTSSTNVNVPKCPTCGSTKIRKISSLSKAGSVAMWGIFSQKVHKQWHCDNCGSEW